MKFILKFLPPSICVIFQLSAWGWGKAPYSWGRPLHTLNVRPSAQVVNLHLLYVSIPGSVACRGQRQAFVHGDCVTSCIPRQMLLVVSAVDQGTLQFSIPASTHSSVVRTNKFCYRTCLAFAAKGQLRYKKYYIEI